MAFDSRKEVFYEIVEALNDSTLKMIGVYGTDGLSMKLPDMHAQEVKLFGRVVIATVSVFPNIEEIQDQIAEQLGLTLVERTKSVRASRLKERFEKETKILVVLDDIWKRLDLNEVGISHRGQHGGCKILMTDQMDAEKTIEELLRCAMGLKIYPSVNRVDDTRNKVFDKCK